MGNVKIREKNTNTTTTLTDFGESLNIPLAKIYYDITALINNDVQNISYEPRAEGTVERNSATMTLKIFLPSSIAVILDCAEEFQLITFLANKVIMKTIIAAMTMAKRNSTILKPLFLS